MIALLTSIPTYAFSAALVEDDLGDLEGVTTSRKDFAAPPLSAYQRGNRGGQEFVPTLGTQSFAPLTEKQESFRAPVDYQRPRVSLVVNFKQYKDSNSYFIGPL